MSSKYFLLTYAILGSINMVVTYLEKFGKQGMTGKLLIATLIFVVIGYFVFWHLYLKAKAILRS